MTAGCVGSLHQRKSHHYLFLAACLSKRPAQGDQPTSAWPHPPTHDCPGVATNVYFLSVFSEEEPDLNSELEISVSDLNKHTRTLSADQFSSDYRDGGSNCWPVDGEAANGSDDGHDGGRLPRLHLPRQQLLRPHRPPTQTRTPTILRWTG